MRICHASRPVEPCTVDAPQSARRAERREVYAAHDRQRSSPLAAAAPLLNALHLRCRHRPPRARRANPCTRAQKAGSARETSCKTAASARHTPSSSNLALPARALPRAQRATRRAEPRGALKTPRCPRSPRAAVPRFPLTSAMQCAMVMATWVSGRVGSPLRFFCRGQ